MPPAILVPGALHRSPFISATVLSGRYYFRDKKCAAREADKMPTAVRRVGGGASIQNLVCLTWKAFVSSLPLSFHLPQQGANRLQLKALSVSKMSRACACGSLASSSAMFFWHYLGWQVTSLRILTEAEGGDVQCPNHTAGWPWLQRPAFLWLFSQALIYGPC